MLPRPPRATRTDTLFPYTTLFRSAKVGYATLSEALDAHLPRIAPASALLGDIIEIEGDGPLGSMGVYVGNGRIFCYHELRSEEHTSELQSLMRISYAVFCLKKKTIDNETKTHDDHIILKHKTTRNKSQTRIQ